jgi:hypothetical protein
VPAVITVTTAADIDKRDDFLSLREAIMVVNGSLVKQDQMRNVAPANILTAAEGRQVDESTGKVGVPGVADTIEFDPTIFKGRRADVINLTQELPTIMRPVIIKGLDATGGMGLPVTLDGSGMTPGDALVFATAAGAAGANGASGSQVQSLIVQNVSGAAIRITGGGGGVRVTGMELIANGQGVVIADSPGNHVGQPAAKGFSNLIIRSTGAGIVIAGQGATGNQVVGNYIGINRVGADARPNDQGVLIDGASDNFIGGKAAGERNIISGNTRDGIDIRGPQATDNQVLANYIGTDRTGTAEVANSVGVHIENAPNNIIGGTGEGATRNIISGNTRNGIYIEGQQATGNKVLGNYIGLDPAGDALGNHSSGIRIEDGGNNTIGGTQDNKSRNVISANGADGIFIEGQTASGNKVLGNYIGTSKDGQKHTAKRKPGAPAPDGSHDLGNDANGVHIYNAPNTVIGRKGSASNVISGNGSDGVQILGQSATGNQVLGNDIGTEKDGKTKLGNGAHGVFLASDRNTVGGDGQGNTIWYNALAGVAVVDGLDLAPGSHTLHDLISKNSIYANVRLGIDLLDNGPTENDEDTPPYDTDLGPNTLQNFPDLAVITAPNGLVKVTGILKSTASTHFNVELFANPLADPSGYGQGKDLLASVPGVTDAHGEFSFAWAGRLPHGDRYVSSTATDVEPDENQEPNNNTSEFSPWVDSVTGAKLAATFRTVKTEENAAVRIELDGRCTTQAPLDLHVTTGPRHGTLSGLTTPQVTNGAGGSTIAATVLYTPNPNYIGPDQLTFTVGDRHGHTAQGIVSILVDAPPPPRALDDAAAGTITLPTTLEVGQSYQVTVTMKNTGTETWDPASYCLRSANQPVTLWGPSSVQLTTPTPAHAVATFDFTIMAPATPGVYNTAWRMMRMPGSSSFGDTIQVTETVVDTTPPMVRFISGPPALTNNTGATVDFQASDGTVACTLDGQPVACTADSATLVDLADGSHTLRVSATDPSGNTGAADYSWTVDTIGPTVRITGAPAAMSNCNSATFTYTLSDGVPDCTLDGTDVSCDSPTSTSFTGLCDGGHTFEICETDAAGNKASASYWWTVDTTPPTVTLDTIPVGYLGQSLDINGAAGDAASGVNLVTVTIRSVTTNAILFSCQATNMGSAFSTWGCLYTPMQIGPETVTITATDVAGNVVTTDPVCFVVF